MKQLKHLLAALVFVSLIIFTSCGGGGGGNEKDPADVQAGKFAKSWTLVASGAKLESETVSTWDSFTLTVNGTGVGGSYTTTNSQSEDVWPASGTWTFAGNDIGAVLRSDDVEIDIFALNTAGTTMTLKFTITSGSVRTSSVNGNWTFSFTSPS